MRFASRGSFISIFAACFALLAFAQTASSPEQQSPNPAVPQGTLTGKERLGPKWMDEQRIDNCKVPIDKCGTKPRPDTCPHVPVG
jgi:hypothetical protein